MPKADERAQYTDDEYRFVASRHLDRLTQDRSAARQSLWDQSRWLLVQLFVVNAGGLATLLAVDRVQRSTGEAGPWFLAGLMLSIAAALLAWVQTRIAFSRLNDMCNPEMVIDPDKWPRDSRRHIVRGNATFWAGSVAGVGSLIAFAVGAYQIDALWAAESPAEAALQALSGY